MAPCVAVAESFSLPDAVVVFRDRDDRAIRRFYPPHLPKFPASGLEFPS